MKKKPLTKVKAKASPKRKSRTPLFKAEQERMARREEDTATLPPAPVRVRILTQGAELTQGDRNKAYGNAVTNMQHMAGMLTAYFRNLIIARGPDILVGYDYKDKPYEFTGEDAAQIMAIAKMSRTANRGVKYHEDNYTDQAVYSAMAGECADKERPLV